MAKVFFFKENNTNDRDCVRYLQTSDLDKGHVCVCGASYSGRFGNPSYENVTTVLTEEEFNILWNWKYGDEVDLSAIIEKLNSGENGKLFAQVTQEETEWLMDEYDFDEDDVERIFAESYCGYYDRGLVSCVYEDAYDLGYETADSCGYVDADSVAGRYFDFEKFGEDLTYDEGYVELDDGRIVSLNL